MLSLFFFSCFYKQNWFKRIVSVDFFFKHFNFQFLLFLNFISIEIIGCHYKKLNKIPKLNVVPSLSKNKIKIKRNATYLQVRKFLSPKMVSHPKKENEVSIAPWANTKGMSPIFKFTQFQVPEASQENSPKKKKVMKFVLEKKKKWWRRC